MRSWDDENGLESHGSASVASGLAHITTPGHFLGMQILSPHSRTTESEIGDGAQQSGASQALQVGLMQLKFENRFSRGMGNKP